MDKKTLLAFILIGLILVLFPYYRMLIYGPSPKKVTAVEEKPKTEVSTVSKPRTEDKPEEIVALFTPSLVEEEARNIVVITDLYRAIFSTRGGVITEWSLKDFSDGSGGWVQLVPPDPGGLDITLPSSRGGLETSSFLFTADRDSLRLHAARPKEELTFTLLGEKGAQLIKRFQFFNDRYSFDLELSMNAGAWGEYALHWRPGLNTTEANVKDDLTYYEAYSMMGDEVIKDSFRRGEKELDRTHQGVTRWTALRTKYFMVALIPGGEPGSKAQVVGRREGEEKWLSMSIFREIEVETSINHRFQIYIGPVDYFVLKKIEVGLEEVVNLGWKAIRPISLLLLRFFEQFHGLVPNYGLVIIIFSVIIKIVFYPLTHRSFSSMRKMQLLQPELKELKEKYKNSPQKLSQETMKLYKKYGVSPLGGCFPLLLQMPVFFALYTVLRTNIGLRGEHFLWISDLSQADNSIYGIPILPIIMGVTMFIQQKITVKDPKQAMMVYLMPILFVLLFKSMPAGLVLYWTMFNFLSIGQQYLIHREG